MKIRQGSSWILSSRRRWHGNYLFLSYCHVTYVDMWCKKLETGKKIHYCVALMILLSRLLIDDQIIMFLYCRKEIACRISGICFLFSLMKLFGSDIYYCQTSIHGSEFSKLDLASSWMKVIKWAQMWLEGWISIWLYGEIWWIWLALMKWAIKLAMWARWADRDMDFELTSPSEFVTTMHETSDTTTAAAAPSWMHQQNVN